MSNDLDRMRKARELERMEKAHGVLIKARNTLLDDLIKCGGTLKAQVPAKASELTSILHAIDALEKALAEERKATNPVERVRYRVRY